jgi:hypothetical protein
MQPSLSSLISRSAGAGEQGEILGVSQSVGSLSRVLGPVAAGALFAGLGRNSPFLWGAALGGLSLMATWHLPRKLATAEATAGAPPSAPGPG